MVTENNSQINTFIKGMNSDTSYSMLQEGQYVYANNLRIFQIDENNQNSQGEVRSIEGIRKALEEYNINITSILAATSIRNIGVIITRNTDNTWSVYTFDNAIGKDDKCTSQDFSKITTFKPIFNSKEELDESYINGDKNSFDVVCRWEDDDNVKLYIADGVNPVMIINLKGDETTDKTSINSISSKPTVKLFPPKVVEVISGKIKTGMVSYAYRMYSKYNQSSEISPATRMYPTVNNTKNRYRGSDYDKYTNCGFKIMIDVRSISENVPQFDHIEIYRILYQVTGQVPTIELIGNVRINTGEQYIYYNDVGNAALSTLTLEEFNTMSGLHIIPQVIESKNDYMFAAKINSNNSSYESEEIKDWDARAFSYDSNGNCILYNYNNTEDSIISWNANQIKSGLFEYDDIPKTIDCFDINNNMLQKYKPRFDISGINYGGTGKNISWKFIFKEIGLDDNVDGNIGRIIKPKDNFGNPKIASEYKSLRRGELYRYGIILYTKNGSHSDVKWIADIRVPEIHEQKFSPFIKHEDKLYGSSIGIEFTVNTDSFPEDVTGYEIVRCNRTQNDIKTLTQGVLSRPIQFHDNTSLVKDEENTTKPGIQSKIYPLMPTGYISTAWWYSGGVTAYRAKDSSTTLIPAFNRNDYQYRSDQEDEFYPQCDNFENVDTYQFISAESTYLKDSTLDLLKDDIYIQPYRYLFPYTNSDISIVRNIYNLQYLSVPLGNNSQVPLYFGYNDWTSYTGQNEGIEWSKMNIEDIAQYLYVFYTNLSIGSNIYWDGKSARHYTQNVGYGEDRTIISQCSKYEDIKTSYNSVQGVNNVYDMFSQVYTPGLQQDVTSWKKIIPYTYSYCKLYDDDDIVACLKNKIKQSYATFEQSSIKIKDIKQAGEPKWNQLYSIGENGNFTQTYDNNTINIGTKTYNNYVMGPLYGVDVNSEQFPMKSPNDQIINNSRGDTLTATGGRCYVIQFDFENNTDWDIFTGTIGVETTRKRCNIPIGNNEYIIPQSIIGTYLCNIQHDVYPYGGGSLSSIETSSYYSYGNFFDTSEKIVEVFDGDCYPTIMEYVSAHKVFGSERKDYQFCTTSIIYSIPLESNINTFLTNGFEFSDNTDIDTISCLQIEPSQISSHLTQPEELYRYNSVYSSYSTHNPYVSESDEIKYNTNNDCRVYFSEMKSNNENIDKWTVFKASNYIDVDSRYGEITALKDFKNTLFFWQEHATGRLASKERSVVSDINNIQLALGTGDILERYDYIDYTHGLHKDQFCLAQSNETLYWFDEHNQSIRATSDGQNVVDLSTNAGVSNYMHKYEQKVKNPKLFFDKKYNELVASVLDDKSIIYNQNYRVFTSFTDITFDNSISFNNGDYLIRTKDNGIEIAQWNCKGNLVPDDLRINRQVPRGWDDESILHMQLKYVVNKQPIVTKVFDNQEIITTNKPYSNLKTSKVLFEHLNYKWNTDLNNSSSDLIDKITDREGNFRYAIPRSDNAEYGNRIRGKYMICELEGESNYDISIQYILTKFRTSFS